MLGKGEEFITACGSFCLSWHKMFQLTLFMLQCLTGTKLSTMHLKQSGDLLQLISFSKMWYNYAFFQFFGVGSLILQTQLFALLEFSQRIVLESLRQMTSQQLPLLLFNLSHSFFSILFTNSSFLSAFPQQNSIAL